MLSSLGVRHGALSFDDLTRPWEQLWGEWSVSVSVWLSGFTFSKSSPWRPAIVSVNLYRLDFPHFLFLFFFFLFCFQLLNIVNHWWPKNAIRSFIHSLYYYIHSFNFLYYCCLQLSFLTVFYFASIIQPFITPLATPYAKNPPAHPQTEAGQTKRRSPPSACCSNVNLIPMPR